ncbi:MAG: hypothetical protein OEY85_04135 [Rhodospirillales bacterium]|nr:hypothetical protein [Rhodospirillales bacterium]
MAKIFLLATPLMLLTLGACAITASPLTPPPQSAGGVAADDFSKTKKPTETASLSGNANAAEPKTPPPAPFSNPSIMIGMAPKELQDLLGPPAFRRHDKPAEIWQYTHGGCVIDVFIYEGAGGGPASATHYEVRTLGEDAVSPEICFSRIITEHKEKKTS